MLKVTNIVTNNSYYLENINIPCAKKYSYVVKDILSNRFLHQHNKNLEYIKEESIIDTLNTLYNETTYHPTEWFPKNIGILLSQLLKDKYPYITNKLNCSNFEDKASENKASTYWCPPVAKRGTADQSTRVFSASYIKKGLNRVLFQSTIEQFQIYNNTDSSLLTPDHIFAMYPSDAYTDRDCSYCENSAIGACNSNRSCIRDCCGGHGGLPNQCKNYKTFISTSGESMWNEVIIKSWNYDENGLYGNGIYYNASSDIWMSQLSKSATQVVGWRDVSYYSKNENIPLLGFGINVPDRYNISDYQRTQIKQQYVDLANNLEPYFNSYRKNNNIPKMPYHIGLDIACLTRDCSTPFFDLADIGIK